MESTQWGVRWSTADGYDQVTMASQDAAEKQVAEMRSSYPWPFEINLISRVVPEWEVVADA